MDAIILWVKFSLKGGVLNPLANKMKIIVLDGYSTNPGDLSWEEFEKLGCFTVYDRTSEDQIIQRIGDAEAVIINKTPMSAATINACGSQY
jgi:glycerate dehydrogenase